VVTQPRVNKNWLLGYTHTLNPNLYNDFRIGYHRSNFDTLNHFSVSGVPTPARRSAFRASTATSKYNNPGLPSINVSNFSTGSGRRHELVSSSTRRSSVERARRTPRDPQRCEPASTCGG
jgi:hypothetical protein